MTEEVKKGQIYSINPDSKKVEMFGKDHKVKIEGYYENSKLEDGLNGLWVITIKDENGDWVTPGNKNIIFSQQLQYDFILEFEPISRRISRLVGIDD